ncbi:hypothetical protein ABFP60_09420 [Clostridioides difficile]
MRKVIYVLLIVIFTFIGCVEKDKTIVVDDNVLMEEIRNSKKITMEELNIPLEDGYTFQPGFIYEDKIYGVILRLSDNWTEEDMYNAYYSKDEGLVKVNKISGYEEYIGMSYKNKVCIGWGGKKDDNYYMVDNTTGDRMKLPEINITKREEIKEATPVKDENGNINIDFLTNEDNQSGMSSGYYKIIEENNNYGYRVITTGSSDSDRNDSNNSGWYYDKIDYNSYDNVQSLMVLFDLENKKSIIYGGELNALEFPVIADVFYSKKNNKFYAIGGYLQDEIYEINIKDDTYNLNLYYKFDYDDRLTRVWNSKILDNSIILETYIPSEIDKEGSFNAKEIEHVLFNLDSKEINVFEKDKNNISYFISNLNSDKYLIINRSDYNSMEGKGYLCRVRNNVVEYMYEIESGSSFYMIMDEDEKIMINYYRNEYESKYEIYKLDIE